MRGYEEQAGYEKQGRKINGICYRVPRPSECSPHLPLFDLAANDLPPLLNNVNQDVALLQELALLTGCIHLRTNSQRERERVLDKQRD